MRYWMLIARTALGLVLGAIVIVLAGILAVLRGPLVGAERLACWVWGVYLGIISERFQVSDPENRQGLLGQPGVHLFLANHPPAITTLILTAWAGVLMRGRVVIVMRAGLPLVSWVMKVTGVGVFIRRGAFDAETFQRDMCAALHAHRDHPVMIICFPDRSRPRSVELEQDHKRARREHPDAYEQAGFSGALQTRVPRIVGLRALLAALPADTTVTQVIVGHMGAPGWKIRPWDVWRPLMVSLVSAQDWLEGGDNVLRPSLYKAWADAARVLETWAKTE